MTIPSRHSVDETVERLKSILQSKGITLFAIIDQWRSDKSGNENAEYQIGDLRQSKSRHTLMLAAPSAAIDLPLKILVAEDARGGVWVAYNSPQYLRVRHGLPENLLANIAVVETLAAKAAE